MKIALWPYSYLPSIGGLEMQVFRLAEYLKKNGDEVLIVNGLPFKGAILTGDIRQIKNNIQKTQKVLEEFKPDVVNVHGLLEPSSFYQTRVLQNKYPLCVTIHGCIEELEIKKLMCRKLISMAAVLNAPSHSFLKSLLLEHPKQRVIYNGLPQPQKRIQTPPQAPILLMVGRCSKEKGFDIAFRSIGKIALKHPNLRVVLIGDGPLFKDLEKLKSELKLDKIIHMTKELPNDQVIDHIDHSQFMIIPSFHEAFGLVAIEAAFRKRAVIASDVLGLSEVVIDQQTGLLVPPGDINALAMAIDRLLNDPQKIIEMGLRGEQRAKKLFSIQTAAKNYREMYEDTIAACQRDHSCA